MKKNIGNILVVSCIGAVWLMLAIISWFKPALEISDSERRPLAQLPSLNAQTILSGEFMKDFEKYTQDQFPKRFKFRTLKAYTGFYLLSQKDNNKIYIEDGYAAKLEYPLKESSIKIATDKFRTIYEKYMKDKENNLYITVIPDKSYYLADKHGYPSMDYEQLFELIKQDTEYAKYIDIADLLMIEDYYKTDLHWKQENLIKVAEKLGIELGIKDELSLKYYVINTVIPFYGVYYGQSTLPLQPDSIKYLTNEIIENCIVTSLESNGTTQVYDKQKLYGKDPYDVYLSGATPLLIIENPNAKTDKELILFRDSFGSSLAPLLLEGYAKVTLVDIRYIASDILGKFIEFDDQDVLFLYSTLILNSATMFK